jgi:hypothetical protein
MELSQIFTGSTLKAADLQGREPTVTIATVEAKKFNDGNKIVITFVGKEKAFVCNKTNANRIAYAHGTNTDNWVGKQIQLYTDLVDFQGQTVEAIRVRPPTKPAPTVSGNYELRSHNNISTGGPRQSDDERSPQPPVRRADPDDPIPF